MREKVLRGFWASHGELVDLEKRTAWGGRGLWWKSGLQGGADPPIEGSH